MGGVGPLETLSRPLAGGQTKLLWGGGIEEGWKQKARQRSSRRFRGQNLSNSLPSGFHPSSMGAGFWMSWDEGKWGRPDTVRLENSCPTISYRI